jgi:hypothetical protein
MTLVDKPVPSGVHIEVPTCYAAQAVKSSNVMSSFQEAMLCLRAMQNELEYGSGILERIRDGCVSYIKCYFKDIKALAFDR